MKKNSKLSLTELKLKTTVITKTSALNAVKGGETTIPMSHGDEAGTPKGGTKSSNPLPVPKPTLP